MRVALLLTGLLFLLPTTASAMFICDPLDPMWRCFDGNAAMQQGAMSAPVKQGKKVKPKPVKSKKA